MRKEVKHPRDANQLGKFIVDVATGEQEATYEVGLVNEFARAGGLKGGRVRSERLSLEQRKEIAKRAAKARWQKIDDWAVINYGLNS